MSICKIKNFSGVLPPGPPLTGEGRRKGKKTGGEEEGKGENGKGGEGYRIGRRGGDKEEAGSEKGGKHTPGFPKHPQFDLSGNKPV
jgi:hypothetical protein